MCPLRGKLDYAEIMDTIVNQGKFQDPYITAKGEPRASVSFDQMKTLWFNTGSLCNIECANCYIQSSPTADHFVYLTRAEIIPFLDTLETLIPHPIEIGLTGGEPFLNPEIIAIMIEALARGHQLLVLTNAMRPMMRPRVKTGLLALHKEFSEQITLRVSLDHYSANLHDHERGAGSFKSALEGLNWLSAHGFTITIAGRADFAEDESEARAGFAALIKAQGWNIDANDPVQLVLFPEMDAITEVPEITTACWDILNVKPESQMCAHSRMIVRRKNAKAPSVLPCTLLWDDPKFDMGQSLKDALKPVQLNHPNCAKFCVLGGASCSA